MEALGVDRQRKFFEDSVRWFLIAMELTGYLTLLSTWMRLLRTCMSG